MANDFSSDEHCMALWRFENGALTADSKGTNTLTNNAAVVANLADFKEGAASADFEESSSQYFSITDANLDANFPLKNGDTNKKISVCCWFQLESLSAARGLFGKYNHPNERCLTIRIESNGNVDIVLGHTGGGSSEGVYAAGTLVINRWYHLGFTFQDSDKSWQLVVWDDTGSTKVINTSGNTTNNISVENATVTVGASYLSGASPVQPMDGEIDEVVVFKDILTTAEIDAIRGGTYSPTILVNDAAHAHAADSPALVQILAILAVNDSSHVHTADSPTLLAIYDLLVNDATHVHTADSPLLVVYLAVLDAIHSMSADSPLLSFIPRETLKMIFTGKVPGVDFTAAKPGVKLTAKKPGVEFE